jgi:transcriptional regulator with XRE-family HTH domain
MPDPEYIALGRALAALRRRAGLTQVQAGDTVDVGSTYISAVERGHKGVSWKTLNGLLRAYNTTLKQLAEEIERGFG